MIKINWTPKSKKEVIRLIDEWIKKYDAESSEVIMQDDDCQIYAPVLLGDIVDMLDIKRTDD